MSSTTSSRVIGADSPLGGEHDESAVCSRSLRMREQNKSHLVCSEPLPALAEDTSAAGTSTVKSSFQDKQALSAMISGARVPSVASGEALLEAVARSGSAYDRSGASEVADPAATAAAPGAPALTSEEESAIQEEDTQIKEPAEPKPGKKTRRGRPKRRTSRAKKKKGRVSTVRIEETADAFDEWVGRRLKAWKDEEAVEPGGGLPPVESGVTEEIDFDPSKDEIGGKAWVLVRTVAYDTSASRRACD